MPCLGLTARLAQHPLADRDDQPRLFGNRNELVRKHESQGRDAAIVISASTPSVAPVLKLTMG